MAQLLPDAARAIALLTVASASQTQTFAYPDGTASSSFGADGDHILTSRDFSQLSSRLGHITITFGASDITVVNNSEVSFKVGQVLHLDLDVAGYDGSGDVPPAGVEKLILAVVDLGTPDASDSDGAVLSQACTAAGGLATGINGVLAADGVATFDVPRNVVAAWTGTAVLTVTGTDRDGNVMVESSGSGTSMTGKKAFKTITNVTTSADITALTVGTSKVLGLPVFIKDALDLHEEREDGVAPTAGTLVVGDQTTATATTGDVRGTYAPNSNPNGSLNFELICYLRSASFIGGDQFSG